MWKRNMFLEDRGRLNGLVFKGGLDGRDLHERVSSEWMALDGDKLWQDVGHKTPLMHGSRCGNTSPLF